MCQERDGGMSPLSHGQWQLCGVQKTHVATTAFSQLKATELGQLLIGARENGEVLIFNSHRLDCYSGFGADSHPSGVFTHRNPQNETFLLLAYQRQVGTTLLRMVQLVAANEATNFDGNDGNVSRCPLRGQANL